MWCRSLGERRQRGNARRPRPQDQAERRWPTDHVRVADPSRSTSPSASMTTGRSLASHASRRAVSGGAGNPDSNLPPTDGAVTVVTVGFARVRDRQPSRLHRPKHRLDVEQLTQSDEQRRIGQVRRVQRGKPVQRSAQFTYDRRNVRQHDSHSSRHRRSSRVSEGVSDNQMSSRPPSYFLTA